jgi:hypothetical protein
MNAKVFPTLTYRNTLQLAAKLEQQGVAKSQRGKNFFHSSPAEMRIR